MKFIQEKPKAGVICNYGIIDHFRSSYISLDFILPLSAENATGMSLLAGVLSRGSENFPSMDVISRYLAENYGASFSINAGKAGEMEILTFATRFLDNECAIDGEDIRAAILTLLQEIIFRPLVDKDGFFEEYVAQEKQNLADKITGLFNDKRLYALERCKALMCADEPFGICELGDLETLKTFNRQTLYRFFQNMVNNAQIVITYVGKEEGDFLNSLADGFAERASSVPEAILRDAPPKVQEIIDPMKLNQSKLNLGFRLGPEAQKNGAACRLFNVLYGGSANSKLFMNVRERLSLCYYCSSAMDRFKNVMFVASGVESEKYEQARAEIEAQLKAVAIGDFTDDEFQSAKSYLIDSVRGMLDSESALAASIISSTLRGEVKTIEQEIKEIEAVSREDLIAVAKEIKLDTVYFLKGVQNGE